MDGQSQAQTATGTGTAAPPPLPLDASGIGRSELVRHDLADGMETIQVRVDFGPGAAFPRHSHPGVEIAFVISGTMQYTLEGRTVVLEAGQSLFIPTGVVHAARNIGSGTASELASYMVEKGKPLVVLAD